MKTVLAILILTMTAGAGLAAGPSTSSLPVKYITLEGLAQSLPSTPIVAGFDIDDTVLFSTPAYYYGANNGEGPGGTNRYGSDYLANPQFRKDLNQDLDKFSMKKKAGDELIAMHKRRGDTIVFITKRNCYDDDAEVIRKRLNRLFALSSQVFCTNEQSKTPYLEKTGARIYYGDADTDIEYSMQVKGDKVRPIRVERSRMSTNKGGYHPGKYGEEILADSEN
ncbi:HAD family acid phosphatase [Geomonas ferrireducens]|uniref:HAD family acid phosphatase n=1 Tax=Geomonas ferrireducens TaxID=2570227 RepID=UPI0010A8622F|nr:HAD family acid phosphatase [Geomonas ferrireducens]